VEHGQIDQKATAVPRAERRSAPPHELESAVAALTLEQKVALLTGVDNFTMPGEPEIGLRGLVFSDGPAGVRGPVLDPADRSSSLPAPIALAALWDPELVERVGAELGVEAKAKGVDALLAPTLNLARSPYGGRGFESYGEDPVLAASTGAAFVRGVQSAGVAMVAKHFVGNDAEVDRWTVDVRMDEATLREVYLVPFEAAVTEADCAAVMAGYNLVNGTTMTEHEHLLGEVLKKEWGFTGAVVSDWFAARSTEAAAASAIAASTNAFSAAASLGVTLSLTASPTAVRSSPKTSLAAGSLAIALSAAASLASASAMALSAAASSAASSSGASGSATAAAPSDAAASAAASPPAAAGGSIAPAAASPATTSSSSSSPTADDTFTCRAPFRAAPSMVAMNSDS